MSKEEYIKRVYKGLFFLAIVSLIMSGLVGIGTYIVYFLLGYNVWLSLFACSMFSAISFLYMYVPNIIEYEKLKFEYDEKNKRVV